MNIATFDGFKDFVTIPKYPRWKRVWWRIKYVYYRWRYGKDFMGTFKGRPIIKTDLEEE